MCHTFILKMHRPMKHRHFVFSLLFEQAIMFQQLLRTTNPPRPQPVSRSNMSSTPSPVFLDITSRDSKNRSPSAATAQPHLLRQNSNLDIENALLSASEVCARPCVMVVDVFVKHVQGVCALQKVCQIARG
jgi:hypothetical protein